ncbi:para-aminobenzoate synthase component I, partial [Corchorus olitorius]
ARHLGDLARLLDEFSALLALGVLQGPGTVIGQPGLQDVQVVGDARHRPTGHIQRQLLGLGQLDELIECLAVCGQCAAHVAAGQLRQLRDAALQFFDALAQGLGVLGIGTLGITLLMQAQAEDILVERRGLLEAIEALAQAIQRSDPDRRDHRRQGQHQRESQPQLAGHAQVGKTAICARLHCSLPPRAALGKLAGYPRAQSGNGAEDCTSHPGRNNGKKLRSRRFQNVGGRHDDACATAWKNPLGPGGRGRRPH